MGQGLTGSVRVKARPNPDEYFLNIALVVSSRATCVRRKVGCVLVDKNRHILATGYNGNAADLPHCYEHPCEGANAAPGTQLGLCDAIHAEQNALLQCRDVTEIVTAYVTVSPCEHCVKMLMNTGCRVIVFLEEYPSPRSKDLWLSKRLRQWYHFGKEITVGK